MAGMYTQSKIVLVKKLIIKGYFILFGKNKTMFGDTFGISLIRKSAANTDKKGYKTCVRG